MSLTLLRKSLDVLEDRNEEDKLPASGRYASKSQRGKKSSASSPSSQAGKHKSTRGIRKKTVQDIKAEMKDNPKKMELNVRRLLALSQNSVKNADAEKILKHVNKGRVVELPETTEEQSSIFTEEDFAKFEKEYFG